MSQPSSRPYGAPVARVPRLLVCAVVAVIAALALAPVASAKGHHRAHKNGHGHGPTVTKSGFGSLNGQAIDKEVLTNETVYYPDKAKDLLPTRKY